jgi:fused signal recognition particle receptor
MFHNTPLFTFFWGVFFIVYFGVLKSIFRLPGLPPAKDALRSLPLDVHLPSTLQPSASPDLEKSTKTPAPYAKPKLVPTESEVAPIATWSQRLKTGLSRTQRQIVKSLDEFFLSKEDRSTREQTFEKLFEILIQSDVGVTTSELLVARVKECLKADDWSNVTALKDQLREQILLMLKDVDVKSVGTIEENNNATHVVLMVGVNGVGKTTTTGKLAYKSSQRGQKVVVGAADTFRAAAVEQLEVWAKRAHADFVRLKEGADPASVAFESTKIARDRSAQLCLIDTAGRLHNRQDLMQELAKIRRSVAKDLAGAPHEVLLVLDATTGQNALQQARIFREVVEITGLVLTKLDGTAKGGVAIAIANELRLPIRYIGVGESVEDLEIFRPQEFVDALFSEQRN